MHAALRIREGEEETENEATGKGATMESTTVGLFGAVGTTAFFAFVAFAAWLDYRKKKDERDAVHRERMKALELGHPPLDAEIERAKAYASAAWAAGLIGMLVPLALASLTVVGTIVAVVNLHPGDNITVPLIVAWSIAAGLVLIIIVRSLSVIRHLPRPTGETPPRANVQEKQPAASSTAFQEKRSEL
jgi:hypothetical protein